jgi:hypothetical protein
MQDLKSSTQAVIKTKANELDASRNAISADVQRHESALQMELVALGKDEAEESARHQQQILEMKASQLDVTTKLHTLILVLDAAERIANQKLVLRNNADEQLEGQELVGFLKIQRCSTFCGDKLQ